MSAAQNRQVRSSGKYVETLIDNVTVSTFIPSPLPPTDPPLSLDGQIQDRLRRAHHALGRLDGLGIFASQLDLDMLIYAFVRKEAVLSSQIEGTQSSLSELLLFEADEAPGVPLDDAQESLNYLNAFNAAYHSNTVDGIPIVNRLIRNAHRELLQSGRGASKGPGQFRRVGV